jgi:hypothetical protein
MRDFQYTVERSSGIHAGRNISLIIIFFLLLCFMPGCLGSFGKIRPQSGKGEPLTIDDLEKNWTDYTVHYAGSSPERPLGVMFDPKNDGKTLLPGSNDRWTKIEDEKTLSEIIGWIKLQSFADYNPMLYKVLGPDDQLYGYLLSGRSDVTIEVFDDRTMFVNDLPDPLSNRGR